MIIFQMKKLKPLIKPNELFVSKKKNPKWTLFTFDNTMQTIKKNKKFITYKKNINFQPLSYNKYESIHIVLFDTPLYLNHL